MPQDRRQPDTEIYEGTVAKVNQNGFQLTGYGSDWFNISQYADPRPDLPIVGDFIGCGVDNKGYVYTVEIYEAANGPRNQSQQRPPQQRQQGGQQSRQNGQQRPPQQQSGGNQQRAASGPSQAPAAATGSLELTREQRARALAIETAGHFLASRTEAKARDVLVVAGVWARFILTGEMPSQQNPNGQQQRQREQEPEMAPPG